jgi:hypothetical protein
MQLIACCTDVACMCANQFRKLYLVCYSLLKFAFMQRELSVARRAFSEWLQERLSAGDVEPWNPPADPSSMKES